MGYCYDARTRQLCCDACGEHGGVIRKRCPFNWCQATALCAGCRAKHGKGWTGQHREQGCERSRIRYVEEERARAAAAAGGFAVIRAGVNLPSGLVFAWTSQGNFEVPQEVYKAGLDRQDHVLDVTGALRRDEERPQEVYG